MGACSFSTLLSSGRFPLLNPCCHSPQSFDCVIKEKDVELQHLANSFKDQQRAKQEMEENLSRTLREKDAIISQLQQALEKKSKDLDVSWSISPLP